MCHPGRHKLPALSDYAEPGRVCATAGLVHYQDIELVWINCHPLYEELRADRRFPAYLEKVGLVD